MMKKIDRKIITAAIAATFAAAPVYAGGGALGGGATEWTQIANNAELMAQVGEAVQTTGNTLLGSTGIWEQLKQLAPEQVKEILRNVPVKDWELMSKAATTFTKSSSSYKDVSKILFEAVKVGQKAGVTPSEYLNIRADLATREGGIYRETFDREQEKLKNLVEVSSEIRRQGESLGQINTPVAGLQALAGQNIQIQSLLVGLNESTSKANALAADRAMKEKDSEARRAKAAAIAEEELLRACEKNQKFLSSTSGCRAKN